FHGLIGAAPGGAPVWGCKAWTRCCFPSRMPSTDCMLCKPRPCGRLHSRWWVQPWCCTQRYRSMAKPCVSANRRRTRPHCKVQSGADLHVTYLSLTKLQGRLVAIVKEHIMPQAILFDLDDTLTDRIKSIMYYAQRFQSDFADDLASTTISTIAAALLTA